MKTRRIAAFLMALAPIAVPVATAQSKPRSDSPNILFIVTDDHGWGDLPANGDDTEVQMPSLDALATGGALFRNYHTEPLCAPSRACMFTGQYSMDNGLWRGPVKSLPGAATYRGIRRDVKMLSEYLSEAGYHTGAFGKWHMGYLEGEVPNDRGFDAFRGFLSGSHSYWVTKQRSNIKHNSEPDDTEGHTTELFTQWAEGFIRENAAKDEPFFCYLAYNAVHGPIRTDESRPASAPEAWVNKALDRGVSFLRSDYVAILEHLDHNIGQLVDLLDELKIAENTLIVFVSDNGGCTMGDDTSGTYPGNNGAFRGGKGTTYQGGLNVPFLMNWKSQIPAGTVSGAHVMHADIFATLLDAAHIPLPEMNGKNPMRGLSLMPHMLSAGEDTIPNRTMIFELVGSIGLRKGDHKLWAKLESHRGDWKAHVAELKQTDLALFDLSQDIGEQNDLRTQLPEVYTALKTELIDYFSQINAEYPIPETSGPSPKEAPAAKPKAKAPRSKNRGSKSGPLIPEKLFKARDKNQDGELSLEEYTGKPVEEAPARTKIFQGLDADGDGKLTLEELKKAEK